MPIIVRHRMVLGGAVREPGYVVPEEQEAQCRRYAQGTWEEIGDAEFAAEHGGLDQLSKGKLLEIALELNVPVGRKDTKADLIAAIESARAGGSDDDTD